MRLDPGGTRALGHHDSSPSDLDCGSLTAMTWQTGVGSIFCILCTALACRNGTTPTPASAELTAAAISSAKPTPATLRPPPDDPAIPTATAPLASNASTTPTPTSTPPKLKPVIGKPFPEGASEQVVCEAIDSTEPDLWVRFGHIIPMYVYGAIIIVETTEVDVSKLKSFIRHDYHHGMFLELVKGCRSETALIYLRRMSEQAEYLGKPVGRLHFSQELQATLGVRTRESFRLYDDHERLSEYCRADAKLCEQLVKVDYANEGKGLCPGALTLAGITSLEERYPGVLQQCLRIPASVLACAYYNYGGAQRSRSQYLAQQDCGESILIALEKIREHP